MMRAETMRKGRDARRTRKDHRRTVLLGGLGLAMLGGCVQVTAPERPIEINLNITIRQEVVVRLQQDVRELIEQNPGVF
jgi:hypothetical protein